MALNITEDCISCGACEPECRNTAIRESESSFLIEAEKCTECVGWFDSPQCASVCPVDACVPDPSHKETREQLLAKWHRLNPGKEPASA